MNFFKKDDEEEEEEMKIKTTREKNEKPIYPSLKIPPTHTYIRCDIEQEKYQNT